MVEKISGVLIALFRRQCEPADGGFPVLGNILAQQVQLSEGILGVLVSLLRRLRQPADSARCILCHAIAAQQQLAQLVLRELVSKIGGLSEPAPGSGGIVCLQTQLDREALVWFEKVARQRNPYAEYQMAKHILADPSAKRVSLHASAVRKHPTQVMHGQGVAVEGLLHEEAAGLLVILGPSAKRERTRQAVDWLTHAAEAGLDCAQYALGKLYRDGGPVAQDMTQAVIRFSQAAERGNQYAMYALGKLRLEVLIALFRRQCEPADSGFPVLGNILAQQRSNYRISTNPIIISTASAVRGAGAFSTKEAKGAGDEEW